MKIEEITFTITKNTTHVVNMSNELGYAMSKTAKALVDLVTQVRDDPLRGLAWDTDTAIEDSVVIDDYEIIEE